MVKRILLALFNRLGLVAALRETWRRDVDRARDTTRQSLREDLKPLRDELESLADEHRKALRRLRLVEATLERNRAQESALRRFHSMRTSGEIERHVVN